MYLNEHKQRRVANTSVSGIVERPAEPLILPVSSQKKRKKQENC